MIIPLLFLYIGFPELMVTDPLSNWFTASVPKGPATEGIPKVVQTVVKTEVPVVVYCTLQEHIYTPATIDKVVISVLLPPGDLATEFVALVVYPN